VGLPTGFYAGYCVVNEFPHAPNTGLVTELFVTVAELTTVAGNWLFSSETTDVESNTLPRPGCHDYRTTWGYHSAGWTTK
jgi:hypothetical protein